VSWARNASTDWLITGPDDASYGQSIRNTGSQKLNTFSAYFQV